MGVKSQFDTILMGKNRNHRAAASDYDQMPGPPVRLNTIFRRCPAVAAVVVAAVVAAAAVAGDVHGLSDALVAVVLCQLIQ